jgi:hypothetical protein
MCSQLNDLSPKFLKVVINISDLLLLLQVSSLQVTQTTIHLYLKVSLQLLHMLNHSLLLPVQMSDSLLMLPFNEFNNVLGLAYHSIVFIVELLHSQNVVGAGLFSEL